MIHAGRLPDTLVEQIVTLLKEKDVGDAGRNERRLKQFPHRRRELAKNALISFCGIFCGLHIFYWKIVDSF
ncbi:MAG: hypothetical protein FWD70_07865 [Desulfuromonadales bacterium]|nr:hypothetical protein [Desulfuromonadales bacterium]